MIIIVNEFRLAVVSDLAQRINKKYKFPANAYSNGEVLYKYLTQDTIYT